MYPSRELKILAERREYLQLRIAARREDCIVAGEGIREGFERIATWTHIFRAGGMVGAVGSSLFGFRRSSASDELPLEGEGKSSWGQKVVQWAPVALRAFRLFSSFV